MHPSALNNGKLFFDTYTPHFLGGDESVRVVEIGSQDVNGSIRQFCPQEFEYIGVDFVDGMGVDLVITSPYELPFEDNSVDIVVSSSCFEHSEMFWVVYLEIVRILKPHGLFYLNVPSNGMFHRYPVDCWRFYPDSGQALVTWAQYNNFNVGLLESYTSNQIGGEIENWWNDFVAVYVKNQDYKTKYPKRILYTDIKYTNGVLDNLPVGELLNLQDHNEDQRVRMMQLVQAKEDAHVILQLKMQQKQLILEKDDEYKNLKRQVSNAEQRNAETEQQVLEKERVIAAKDHQLYIQSQQHHNYKKLLAIRLIKPLIKTEQAISSAHTLRKGFRRLVKEKGSIGKAYQHVRRLKKSQGFRAVKLFLRSPSKSEVALIEDNSGSNYAEWIRRYDILSSADKALIEEHIKVGNLPSVSIVWILDTDDVETINLITNNLQQQIYKKWNCIFVTERTTVEAKRRVSHQINDDAINDDRLRVVSFLRDEDLASLMDKSVVIIQDAGILAEHALYMFALAQAEGCFGAFCDSDFIDIQGNRHSPLFAPKYSPEFPAVGKIGMIRMTSEVLNELKNQEQSINNTQQTLVNTFGTYKIDSIKHIPFVLFHEKSRPLVSSRKGQYLPDLDTRVEPKISIIIPTRDRMDFMEPCISSILQKTDYPREKYEIVVVDNGSTEEALLQYLDKLVRENQIILIRDSRKFNYSRLNNEAVKFASGDFLAFVNNDIVVNDSLWLRRLVNYSAEETVGAVGAKLLYPDMTVQHGGVVIGIQGVAAHAHHHLKADDPGYMGLSNATHAISAVTGACLMVKRRVFEEVGGFDENLAVAFNDVLFCMAISEKGYRNIYIGEPLLIHFESKTRGYDDTEEKKALFRSEARYARTKFKKMFKNDPYYNENLSLQNVYALAFPPRMEKPWHRFRRESSKKLKILMLSSTHQIGHGVAVVVDLQARHLASEGHIVFVGGPLGDNEFTYPNCHRVCLVEPQEAAEFAMQQGFDCVVMHTPPFYSTTRWLGSGVKTLAYDYGEPNPDFFPDAKDRKGQLQEKAFCLEMADALYAISEAVKNESPHDQMGVIPLGNSHLATWSEEMSRQRMSLRAKKGWRERTVILNVCRFHEGERYYKGIDEFCNLRDAMFEADPNASDSFVFVLAGKGTQKDVKAMEARGLTVFSNVSDDELIDLYCAADVYVNFSKWEGYNLGIGQALAMGLPVIASDIPAHRAFGIFTSNNINASVSKLKEYAQREKDLRIPKLSPWSEPLNQFSEVLNKLCFEFD